MKLSDVAWLMPGFLCVWTYARSHNVRYRSGWDYVLPVALSALILSVIATMLSEILLGLLPSDAASWRRLIHSVLPIEHSGRLVLALLLGAIAGRCGGAIVAFYDHTLRAPKKQDPYTDLLTRLSADRSKLTMLFLSNGKFYIGVIYGFTSDPNDADRYVSFRLVASGHRDKETLKIAYTTWYDSKGNTVALFSFKNVLSIGDFDRDLFERQVAEKQVDASDLTMETPAEKKP